MERPYFGESLYNFSTVERRSNDELARHLIFAPARRRAGVFRHFVAELPYSIAGGTTADWLCDFQTHGREQL